MVPIIGSRRAAKSSSVVQDLALLLVARGAQQLPFPALATAQIELVFQPGTLPIRVGLRTDANDLCLRGCLRPLRSLDFWFRSVKTSLTVCSRSSPSFASPAISSPMSFQGGGRGPVLLARAARVHSSSLGRSFWLSECRAQRFACPFSDHMHLVYVPFVPSVFCPISARVTRSAIVAITS